MSDLRRYLVGGAVRDQLLGLPVKDRDWLVIGASPAQMLSRGFRQVGRHFPVFLDPQTGEEHALPRGDRVDGPAALDDDLRHRDLSINALALDQAGQLIDPCGGLQDLHARVLRHLPRFRDDPLRLLRVARFSAQLPGFSVADGTLRLMGDMVRAGELRGLPAERVFGELERAMQSPRPTRFVEVLRACGALKVLFPALDRLFGIPQPPLHHPEIDTGVHTLMSLQQATQLSQDPATRLAALLHDLGKGETPAEHWPRHIGHEERGVAPIERLADRVGLPKHWRSLAILASRQHLRIHRAFELRPVTLLKLFQETDALRQPQRFQQLLLVCKADARGRTGHEQQPYPQEALLGAMLTAAAAVDAGKVAAGCASTDQIPEALRRARLTAIGRARRDYPTTAQEAEGE